MSYLILLITNLVVFAFNVQHMGQNRQTQSWIHTQTHEDNRVVQEIEGLRGNFPGMTKLVKLPPHILLS